MFLNEIFLKALKEESLTWRKKTKQLNQRKKCFCHKKLSNWSYGTSMCFCQFCKLCSRPRSSVLKPTRVECLLCGVSQYADGCWGHVRSSSTGVGLSSLDLKNCWLLWARAQQGCARAHCLKIWIFTFLPQNLYFLLNDL